MDAMIRHVKRFYGPVGRSYAAHKRLVWSVVLVVLAAILLLLLLWPGWAYQWDWTGFGASKSPIKNPKAPFDYYPSKTLWDWLQLLVIGLVTQAMCAIQYLSLTVSFTE